MYKLLRFWGDIIKSDSPKSSKRFFGGIGFICSIAFVGIWAHELINELLYTSAVLIGIDTVKKTIMKQ